MLAGELYFANDPELTAERHRAQHLLAPFNDTDAGDLSVRTALLRELLGAVGDGADVQPRFNCDYGYNIRLGRNCFINYNCVFLDCAPIEIGDELQMAPAVQLYTAYTRSIVGPAPPVSNTPSRSAAAAACGSAAVRSCCRGSQSATVR